MQVVGIFITVVGCLFIALGATQVVTDMVLAFRPRDMVPTKNFAGTEVDALAALVTAIGKLPPFALMVFTGLVLLAVGERFAAGLQVLAY